MTDRSARPEVRNPVLRLPSAHKLDALPDEARALLRTLLGELADQAEANAEKAYRKSKPPMYAYWAAWKVNFNHLKHAVRR